MAINSKNVVKEESTIHRSKIDFDAIRRKVSQLSGEKKREPGDSVFWKPETGKDYNVRIIPFKNNDGQPFKERWFYYNIGNNPGILTLRQFGERDPFQELIDKLRGEKTVEGDELAKKLYPKLRGFAAVLVRGEEDKGVKLWSFGKTVYQSLLNIMLDSDYGDITDPSEGHDLKVKVVQIPGRKYTNTEVLARPKPSKLAESVETINSLLASIPDLDEIYVKRSYDELNKIVSDWIAGGATDEVGTVHPPELDESEVTPHVMGSSPKKTFKDIDEVFSDLEK